MFSPFGRIEEIFLHQKPTTSIPNSTNKFFPSDKDVIYGYKVGYIVFSDVRSVKEIIQLKTNEIQELILEGEIHSGISSMYLIF